MNIEDLHFKSRWDNDGIRYRLLRNKEAERYEYLGIERFKDNPRYFKANIYTVDQAEELGIRFRGESTDWKKELPGVEKRIWGQSYIYSQKDDWVVTERGTADGEYWVMQVLWRNEGTFAHIRTATGTYPFSRGAKKFDGADLKIGHKAGTKNVFALSGWSHGGLSEREKLLCMFLASMIIKTRGLNKHTVRAAYIDTYGWAPTWHRVADILNSGKLMPVVADHIATALKKLDITPDFVLEQLKAMATTDYKDDPKRRERVTRLLGAMVDVPTYEHQLVEPPRDKNNIPIQIDAETENDLKMLGG